ncbi:MAG: trimethylamine methyltransferase family protein [Candidatus Brocadiae bacterium]|nr:trimethylamine methyltransferase family protein [Candidatus Brocadiia bacterium]
MTILDRTTLAFQALTEEQIYRLHLASLEVLERTGVSVQEEEARSLLLDAGAYAGSGDIVRVPARLVKQALATAPEKIVMHDRNGRRVMPLEGDNVFFGTGSDTLYTIDPYTRQRRRALKEDVRKIAALCDYLDNIAFVMGMGVPADVPSCSTFVHEFDSMINGTTKPLVVTAIDNRDLRAIYEMAAVVAGGEQQLRERPFLILYAEPIAPLQHSKIGTEKLLFCAERGIPCAYIPAVMAGGNGPVTLAGSMAMANAEVLSGLVISQLKSPGAPFVYGVNVSVIDMRSMVCAYADPEFAMANSIFAAMAHYYKLPVWGLAGAADSKTLDAQAAAEAMLGILMAVLGGGNLVHDVGYLESGLTSCMEMILLSDELISMCRWLARGFKLDDNSFALDVIDQIGPGGQFLDCDHTLDNWRTAHWYPRFMDRRRYHAWKEDGCPDMYDRLNVEVRSILQTHTVEPLPAEKREEIARIIAAFEAEHADDAP